ncbi:hypothetical protein Tco_0539738 [Tanacetum coccineum]
MSSGSISGMVAWFLIQSGFHVGSKWLNFPRGGHLDPHWNTPAAAVQYSLNIEGREPGNVTRFEVQFDQVSVGIRVALSKARPCPLGSEVAENA